jgi:uncharacterized protein (DUF58 family)
MKEATPLFGFRSEFLRKLEQVALRSRRPLVGASAGPRRSPRHGSSSEFADFRDYAPGDDLRRVDWNAYARLDRLFLRLYSAEEVATLTLLLDRSHSMAFGEPPKALTAARLAAIFAYIALHGHDHVAVAGWSTAFDVYLPPQFGTRSIPRVWRFIESMMERPAGGTDVGVLRREGPYRRRGGLAIVLSDFLTESDWRGGLLGLRAANQEVTAVQILAPDELDPDLQGDWALRDVETGHTLEVTGSSRLLREYRAALKAHTAAIQAFCRSHGMAYVPIRSDANLEDTLLGRLQAAGLFA